ncbi:hypothetical protein [Persicitalea sp.]|uniref:hypothetical protein n=1 Tax=Persicitalea sp. TaxID=3100273 RepID=UPI0035932DE2
MKTFLGILVIGMSWFVSLDIAFGQSKFSISVIAAPNFHYIDSEWNVDLPVGNGYMTKPVDLQYRANGYGYSAGLMASYWISKRLSFCTGVLLNNINFGSPTVTTNPDLTASPNDPQVRTPASTVRSFQIPLLLNLRTSSKRLSPYLSAGALTNVYSVTIFEGSKKSDNTVDGIRPYPKLGIGVDYRLNDDFFLDRTAQLRLLSALRKSHFLQKLPNGVAGAIAI